jgi:hypothetical protein
MRSPLKALLTLGMLAAVPAVAQAQTNNASIQATAVVQQPINVVGAVPLDFGNVFPGVNKAVAVTDGTAGRFDVTGQASAPVSMSFVLPGNLSSGGNLLPIGSWTGHHSPTNSPSGGTNFVPSAGSTASAFSGTGQLYVFVGATVSPASNQAAGNYSGSVQMTVIY